MSSNIAAVFLPIVILVLIFQLIMLILGIAGTIFWIWMLINCIGRKFKDDVNKVIWILVIIFLPFIGSLLYFFLVKKPKLFIYHFQNTVIEYLSSPLMEKFLMALSRHLFLVRVLLKISSLESRQKEGQLYTIW